MFASKFWRIVLSFVMVYAILSGLAVIPTAAQDEVPTETAQPTAIPTETAQPTAIPTETAQPIPIPTETAQPIPLPTETAQPTAIPTETAQPIAIPTETALPTAAPTEIVQPTATSTQAAQPTVIPTQVPLSIGPRSENPGPFLSWPLADSNQDNISRLPDTGWTHHFLGITACGDYPSLIDPGNWYDGNSYPGNRNLILPGVSDAQVKWMNNGDGGVWDNAFACYKGHEGIDISQNNGTHVLAAAPGYIDKISGSRYTIRHSNVNGSGQTWYTTYVHVTDMRFSVGTYVDRGTWIANVGSGHLHLEVLYNGVYSGNARNPYGIDYSPFNGCLWSDSRFCLSTLNPVPTTTSLSPSSAVSGRGDLTLTVNGSNFVSAAVVRWNGSNLATTFVSAAQLTALIPAAALAAPGSGSVTVFNPAPGGGISNALPFTINLNNACPTITAWQGEYWSNDNLNGVRSLCRNDANVNFDFGMNGPTPYLPVDHFSVRWTRSLAFDAGYYTFNILHDDGARFYIDGNLLFNEWEGIHHEWDSVNYALTAGTHTIVVELRELEGASGIILNWTINLNNACPTITAWQGEYWSNDNLSGVRSLCRNDANVNFDFGMNGPTPYLPADHFSVRWTRSLAFDAGYYTFNILHDDGARFYIDGNLLFNEWEGIHHEWDSVNYALAAGTHTIVVELRELEGASGIILNWTFGITPSAPTPQTPNGAAPSGNPTFTWTKPAGATLYTLYVHTSANVQKLGAAVTPTCGSVSCSYTPTTLNLTAGSYKWAVRAGNTIGLSSYSIWKTFTVSAPAAPTTVSPSGTISDTHPPYRWNASTGATSYLLQVQMVNNPPTASTTIINVTVPSSACSGTPQVCLYHPASPVLGKYNYQFHVAAKNSVGTSAYSAWRAFSYLVPAIPITVSPSGTISDHHLPYTWKPSDGATSYQLVVYRGTTIVINKSLTSSTYCTSTLCTYHPSTPVLVAGAHTIKVRAKNSSDYSAYSTLRAFTIN